MEIVAVQDLGDMGPMRGEAVPFQVGVKSQALSFAPWLAIVALVAIRRRRAAWLALIPLFAFGILFPFGISFLTINDRVLIGVMVMTVATAVAAWILFPGSGRSNFFVWLIRGTLIYTAAFAVSYFSFAGGMTREFMPALVYTAIGMGAIALAAVFTQLSVRRKPTTARIMIAFGIYAMIACFVIIAGFLAVLYITSSSARRGMGRVLPQIALVALSFGVVVNIITQPYLLLACANDFWRDSMRRLFRLPEQTSPIEHQPAPAVVDAGVESQ